MSPRRPTASQVGDDHIGMAASPRKPVVVVGSFADAEVTLHMPRLPTGTAEQKAGALRQEAEARLLASRWVAAYGMVRRHGCTGARCRKRAHAGDLGVMRELLAMPGLGDEAPKGKRGGPRRFER